MIPKNIRLNTSEQLTIEWDDGYEGAIALRELRDQCPCASCQGETILLHTYAPQSAPELPGKYELRSITPVGHYAVQLAWGDGHDTGIYPWPILRSLCQKL